MSMFVMAAAGSVPALAQVDVVTATGTFSTPGSTGNDSVTGVGFRPKALILYGVPVTSEAVAVHAAQWIGFTDGTDQRVVGAVSDNGAADTLRYRNESNVMQMINGPSDTPVNQAAISSFDADGFTLNYSTATSGYIVHYIAFGGADLQADVGQQAANASPETGVAFQPELVFVTTAGLGAGSGTDTNSLTSFGVFNDNLDEWFVGGYHNNNSTANRDSLTITSAFSGQYWVTGLNWSSSISAIQSNGFSWTGSDGDNFYWLALDVGGLQTAVGSITKSTDTAPVSQSIGNLGFRPQLIFMGSGTEVDEVINTNNNMRMTFGAYDGTTQSSVTRTDANGAANADQRSNSGKILGLSQIDASFVAEGVMQPFSDNSPDIRWTSNNSSAYIIGYFAIEAPQAVTGTVYIDEGATNIGADVTVSIAKNGVFQETLLTGQGGEFAWIGTFATDDIITAYIDDESARAVTITKTGTSTISGFDLYQDRLIVRHDNSGNLTTTDLATADNSGDPDITSFYSISGGALTIAGTIELYVDATGTFVPGGAVTTGALDINGTMVMAANFLTVNGTFDATGGGLTTTGTVRFAAATAVPIISDGIQYTHVEFDNASGTFILEDALDVNGTLELAAGTLDTKSGENNSIHLAGNWLNNGGTFTARSSIVTLDGADQSIVGTETFYTLAKSVTVAGTLTFEAGETVRVQESLNLSGALGQLLGLVSSMPGTDWNIRVDKPMTVAFVNVEDSEVTGSPGNDILAVSSVNGGGNDEAAASPQWIFVPDRYWVGPAGGNTSDAANWANSENACGVGGGAGVPTGDENAVFTNSCDNSAVVDATFNIGGLQINTGYAGTITPNAVIDVDGLFSMAAGTIDFSVNNTDMYISDNVTVTGGNVIAGTGSLTLDGDLIYTDTSSTDFGHVYTGTLGHDITLASDFLASQLTVVAGNRFILDGYDIDINGAITINGTLDAGSGTDGNAVLNVAGNWDMTAGVFTNTSSTVIFDGTVQITSNGKAFNIVRIGSVTAGAEVSTADNMYVDGAITVNNGGATTLDISNDTLFVSADLDWANLDTFTVASSRVTFDGTGAQIIASDSQTYNSIKVTNTSDQRVTFSEAFTTAELVATTLGAKLSFQQSTTFTVTGTLQLEGGLNQEIELDSVDGSTQFTLHVSTGQNVSFVKVANSNAATSDIEADNSVNDGGNDDAAASPHWIFVGAGADVFTIEGTTTFMVPKGVTAITVKAWGGGGAGGGGGTSGAGGDGGGAAFARGTLSVTPGEILTVHVGGGGTGGVGAGGRNSGDGGSGGGRSAILRGTTHLVVAAGGGGGGGGDNSSSTAGGTGGVGGGATGGSGGTSSLSTGGTGGTQAMGGSGGSGGSTGESGGLTYGGQGSRGSQAASPTSCGGGELGQGPAGGVTNGGDGGEGNVQAGCSGGGGGGAGYYGGGGGGNSTAGDAGGGGGGGGSSLVSGTSTSTTDGSGRNAGNNTDSAYAGSAGMGGSGGATTTSGTDGNTGRIVITYVAAAVDISGISDLADNTNVKLAVNGTLCMDVTGTITSGVWTLDNVPILSGQIATVWAEDADGDIATADESSALFRFDGSGTVSGVVLNRHVFTVGSNDNLSYSLTEANHFDNADDEDIMYMVNAGTLLIVDGGASYSDETLRILSGNTLIIGSGEGARTTGMDLDGTLSLSGTLDVAGDWDSTGGTLVTTSGTVAFNGGADQDITSGTVTFYNVEINNTGTAPNNEVILQDAIDIDGTLNIIAGELDVGSDNDITISGNWINSGGTFDEQTGTVIFDGQEQSLLSSETFYNFNMTLTTAATGTLYVEEGTTMAITGEMRLRGFDAANRLFLRSTNTGNPWTIDPSGTRANNYLNVRDSVNVDGSLINPPNSVDAGNTVNWFRTGPLRGAIIIVD